MMSVTPYSQTNEMSALGNSVATTCRRLGIGATHFYQMVKDGELHPIKFGRRTIVLESDLQRLITKKLAESQAEAA